MSNVSEGPLPSALRRVISERCAQDVQSQAESYARKQLALLRRINVYESEMHSAADELQHFNDESRRHALVYDAVAGEVRDIDAKIAALTQERQLVCQQLEELSSKRQQLGGEVRIASQRVDSLKDTLGQLRQETHRGNIILGQLLPGVDFQQYL